MNNKFRYYADKYGPWVLVAGGILLSYLGNCEDYKVNKEIKKEIKYNPNVVVDYKPKGLEKINLEIKNEK